VRALGRRRRRLLAAMLLASVSFVGAPRAAHGHALLSRSDPAPGAVTPADQAPRRLSLQFTEPVSIDGNAVIVLDAQGRRVASSAARVAAGDAARVELDPGPLPPGAYAVRWRVISADNHVVRGTYWFVVGFAQAPPPAALLLGAGAPTLSMLETIGRWLVLLATLGLAGAPLFTLLVLRPVSRARLAREGTDLLPSGAWQTALTLATLLAVGQILAAAAQIEAVSETRLPQALDSTTIRAVLFGSRFAAVWWVRTILGLLLAGLLALTHRGAGAARGPWPARCAAGIGCVLILSTSLAGHAAGARGPWPVAAAVDALHLAAGAVWLGGLLQLLLWLRCALLPDADGERRALARDLVKGLVPRFSGVALASVIVLLATGLFTAYVQIGSPALVLRTAYGQSLLLKLALLVPLLGLAAVNRLRLRPKVAAGAASTDARVVRRMRGLVGAEILVALGLLLVVGLLGSLPPPGTTKLPSPVEMARQAGPLRVTLTVDPSWIGVSRFRVALADHAGAPPADVRQVTMTFTMEGMNMGRTHVIPAPREAGVWEAEGFYLGMPGIAQIGIGVSRQSGSDAGAVFRVEVPDVSAAQLAGLRASLADAVRPAVSSSRLERGRGVYVSQCSVCHGAGGNGNGPAAPSLLPPPSDLTLHVRWHSDEQLLWLITYGVAGTSMVGFADRLDPRDRRDVIAYLRTFVPAPSASLARDASLASPTPAAPPADARTPPRRAPPAAPAPAAEVSDAPAGLLVFGPDYDNNLWIVRLPEGRPRPLTRFDQLEFSSNPAWAPDGQRIVFSYYRLPGGDRIPVPDGTDLHVMNADGTGSRSLIAHDVPGAAFLYPAWSADGAAVYATYVRQGGAGVGIDRIDVRTGSRARVVADGEFPSPSPDGRRLAYVRSAAPPARGQALWWSALDGNGGREIVSASVFDKLFAVRFAPDGRRLVFAAVGQPPSSPSRSLGALRTLDLLGLVRPSLAYANGDLWELWTVDVDGRNLRPITSLGEDLPVAAWSPDGRHIAFLGGGSARSAEVGLTVMGADGSQALRLTAQPGHRGLDWARDRP